MPQEFGVPISYRNLIFGVIPQSDNQVDLTGLHHLVQALIERHCKETVTVYVHKNLRSYAKVNQICSFGETRLKVTCNLTL